MKLSRCWIYLTIFLALICRTTAAFAEVRMFANVPWGSDLGTVKSRLEAANFQVTKIDEDGDPHFEGMLFAQKVAGFVIFANGGAAKVFVRLATPDNDARDVYKTVKDALTGKYGAASNEYAFYESPYFEGDGFEEQAIRIGKGHFAAFWTTENSQLGTMSVKVSEALTVDVTYESPAWGAEADKRKQQEANVL
jgi:hypothetical protein